MAIFSRQNREYLDLFYHFFVKNSTSYLPIGLYPCAAGQSTLGGKRWGRRLRRDAGKALGGRLRRRRDWRSRAGGKGCGGIKSGRSDEWEHNKKGPTDRKNPSDLFALRQRMGTGAGAARLFGMWRGLFHGEGEKHPARALEGFWAFPPRFAYSHSTNPIIWGCILCVFIGKIFAILLMFHLLFSAVNFLSIKIVS